MNHKVLLADDSLTIQKVIKITLANQPYDITECSSEEELFQKLTAVQPKIVYLDFNLSEKFTGYELTQKIIKILPSTKILLLMGTFDNIDDAALERSGAADKIVKPFDSNKFIALSKQLIDSFDEDDQESPVVESPKADVENNPDEQWQMNHSSGRVLEQPEINEHVVKTSNPLAQEISDWGMSVPSVINDSSTSGLMTDIPPVIGKSSEPQLKMAPQSFEAKFPDTDDLDYPSMDAVEVKDEKPSSKSKLVSLENFNNLEEVEIEHSYIPEETNVSSIEDQIRDEVEEDLWKADEFEEIKHEVSHKIEEIKNEFQPTMNDFDETLFKPLDENETIKWNEPEHEFTATLETKPQNLENLRGEIEEMVKKYVKEYMDEMFQKNVEKISWEVIPDLAENLIRQELGKISHKILEEN